MSTRAAGNTYLPFVDLMRLETINDATFRSTAQPFCPGGTHIRSAGRAYGGHVYAQAAWAAAQTVPEGFVLHVSSMSSNHLELVRTLGSFLSTQSCNVRHKHTILGASGQDLRR